eukprot:CAMPEP_0183300740 /NCGR_PEP_ID=MMETSP0160_2-20130417/7058_1 /TAXON_ID=2839 ORGANISM="Odontella Sinensis, Strain Grunow 1884" /NCGR_SAMPLE_ID=MMETSP0160_2 /ASSEMBLY_ACC=CAM_ASM_000250 /LENGTH=66 /DNA_ID=CAMNT_0025463215 /DNA_START=141 /DNA_END=338 /DNA_ORIENTATION=+
MSLPKSSHIIQHTLPALGRVISQSSTSPTRHHSLMNSLHLANNGDGASELLVNHEAKDAHHGSTAV